MRRSDYILIDGEHHQKKNISPYWELRDNSVNFQVAGKETIFQYKGTLSEFEALLFDKDTNVQNLVLEALRAILHAIPASPTGHERFMAAVNAIGNLKKAVIDD